MCDKTHFDNVGFGFEIISPNLCNRFSFYLPAFIFFAVISFFLHAIDRVQPLTLATVRCPFHLLRLSAFDKNTQMKSTLFNMIYFDMQRTGVERRREKL